MKRVYIDSNVFLSPVLYKLEENVDAANADQFLQQIIQKNVEAYTSFLTWDEFVWVLRRNLGRSIAITKGKEFLVFPNLIFDNITREIIIRAQKLMETYEIKPRDAIHLATALQRQIKEIITFDNDFKEIPDIQYHPPP